MTAARDKKYYFTYADGVCRAAEYRDMSALSRVAEAMGAPQPQMYFERCLNEQAEGRRLVILADIAGKGVCGYAQLNFQPLYVPFRRAGIPEVQDLNVVPACRRQGIGAGLLAACEAASREAGQAQIGIGVGLHAGFGSAQRLYIKSGYVPDGLGLVHDDLPVRAGEMRPADDTLSIKLLKDIG